MSDLISRQAVMNYLREQQAVVIIEKTKQNAVTYEACKGMESSIEAFMNFINQIPSDYDVDKVVEQLEKRIKDAEKVIVKNPADKLDEIANETAEAFIEAYKDAIEIVKGGGADE